MPSDPHVEALLDRLLSGLRGPLEGALRSYADESVHRRTEELRRSGETQIAELRAMLEDIRAKARQHQQAVDARLDEALRERDQALARVHRGTADVYGRATRLADESRSMDDAGSLSGILERLNTAAAVRADRSALVVVDGGGMRVWRTHEFAASAERGSELLADGAGMIDDAVRLGRVVTGREDVLPPAFAVPPPRDSAAFPITVGGEVVAVLYVDLAHAGDERRAQWPELDLLARHAGAALEALTFRQAVGLRPVAVARRSQTPSDSGGSAGRVGDVAGQRPFGGLQ